MTTTQNKTTKRSIFSVEVVRAQAEAMHSHLSEQGRHPKILSRTVSAEGVSREVFVVTCDAWEAR